MAIECLDHSSRSVCHRLDNAKGFPVAVKPPLFWIPGHLAYDIIPNANGPKGMLVFDVTLYSFEL